MKRDKAKKILPKGKNIRIPEDQFKVIKKFCDQEGLIMGRFIAAAAISKCQHIDADRNN